MALPLVAFAVVAGVSGVRITPSVVRLAETAAGRLQLADLYGVICEGSALHADAGASSELNVGRDWPRPRAQDYLAFAVAMRSSQADQVSAQDVSQIPDGQLIAKNLGDCYRDRAVVDALYIGQASDSAVDLAQNLDSDAQVSWSEAVRLWNSHAQEMGVPRISEAML